MSTLKAGIYEVEVYDYGLSESQGGEPMVAVVFKFTDPDLTYSWRGSFKTEKSTEKTLEALIVCGLNEKIRTASDIYNAFDNNESQDAIEIGRRVKVTVNMEMNQDETKEYPRIAWINALDSGGYRQMGEEAAKRLKGKDYIGGMLAKMREGEKAKPEKKLDNIPF